MNRQKKHDKTENIFYDQGRLVPEKIEGLRVLRFIYTSFFGRFLRFFIRFRFVSRLYAWYQDSSWSRSKIESFVKKHEIVIDDFVLPAGGFSSFNDFFIRKLKPGTRTIDYDSSTLVAPADSKLLVVENISEQKTFFVKDKPFLLGLFLKNKKLAQKFENGTLLVFRLAPYDYHRYHFPLDGMPEKPKLIKGVLESVNPIAYRAGLLPLQENERHLVLLENDRFGSVACVVVGAVFVARVVHTYTPQYRHKKGDEMGYFAFGGSSIVLLFEENVLQVDKEFIDHSQEKIETAVKMGQRVGVLRQSSALRR